MTHIFFEIVDESTIVKIYWHINPRPAKLTLIYDMDYTVIVH